MTPVNSWNYSSYNRTLVGLAPFIFKASLSSPSERNRARSAFLTVFLPYSHRHAREPDGVGRRVCLSSASYGAAEKSEWRMALKI